MVKILNRKLIWEKRKDQFLKILIFVEIHGMQFYFAGSYNFQSCKIGSFNSHGTRSDDGVIEFCRTMLDFRVSVWVLGLLTEITCYSLRFYYFEPTEIFLL